MIIITTITMNIFYVNLRERTGARMGCAGEAVWPAQDKGAAALVRRLGMLF